MSTPSRQKKHPIAKLYSRSSKEVSTQKETVDDPWKDAAFLKKKKNKWINKLRGKKNSEESENKRVKGLKLSGLVEFES